MDETINIKGVKMKKISKKLITSMILLGVVFLALPADGVFAQEIDPPESKGEFRRRRPEPLFIQGPEGLEKLYNRLVDRYEDMGYRIYDTDDVIRRLEDRIEALIEEGGDPSELEAILAAFNENMAAVEEAYEELGVLIDEHAGFSGEGEVTDEAAALRTLRLIAEGLRDVHQLGENARFDLRWDLMILRYQNAPEE
jgi:DNA-binding transcriptional MerR regulator